jgi:hypothetical protein
MHSCGTNQNRNRNIIVPPPNPEHILTAVESEKSGRNAKEERDVSHRVRQRLQSCQRHGRLVSETQWIGQAGAYIVNLKCKSRPSREFLVYWNPRRFQDPDRKPLTSIAPRKCSPVTVVGACGDTLVSEQTLLVQPRGLLSWSLANAERMRATEVRA